MQPKEIPLGDVTLRQIAESDDGTQHVLTALLDTVLSVKEQGGEFAGHLLRRIFVCGELFRYDPGDEPAMEFIHRGEIQ